jgi:3',5'-cyclic AMP phosphodiesterase CpdA
MNLNAAPSVVRLAHFSDIHVCAKPLGWTARDWFSKRFTGWLNLRFLGRAHRFRDADRVLAALMADLDRRQPDHVIFSGDATTLGFESELARAAALIQLTAPPRYPGLAIPGNHDYYTRAAAATGMFERYFAPWQTGERVDDAVYPFAQRVGPVWLVGINSASGNFWVWDAGGRVDTRQLNRLEQLLARLAPAPRILVTHYPVCRSSGKGERRGHGLRNVAEIVRAAARGGVCLWLHGHRHGPYCILHPPSAPFPVVCAGSATQHGYWSYGEYAIEAGHLHATRRVFSPERNEFVDGESFDVPLQEGAVTTSA